VRAQIEAAVADIMPAERFMTHMLTAFQDEKIRTCTDDSKFKAVHECAALGLLPTLQQVSLIRYGNEVKAMPEWRGYKAIMERHPDVAEVEGELVHVSDSLQVKGDDVHHAYNPLDKNRTIHGPEDILGGYCKIIYSTGRKPKYHFVAVEHIVKAQKCAKTQEVWKAWYKKMARKTLYRDCFSSVAVPLDPMVSERLQKATQIDDALLGNNPARIDTTEAVEDHRRQAREQREAESVGSQKKAPPQPQATAEPTQEATEPPVAPEPAPPAENEQPPAEGAAEEAERERIEKDVLGEYRRNLQACDSPRAVGGQRRKADKDRRLTEEHRDIIGEWCDQMLETLKG
jgi:recombinational DNA repair protein RecT